MTAFLRVLPLVVLAAAGCSKAGGPAKPAAELAPVALPVKPAGVHKLEVAAPSGKTVKYVLSVPRDVPANTKVPLVVTLHYGGKDGDYYGAGMVSDFTGPAVAPLNAVVVAPDCLTGDEWDDPVNAAHVAFLARSVIRSYPVDDKKVLLTGFSAGGIGTWAIVPRCGGLFTAAIPVAGDPQANAANWTTPVYAVHSPGDTVVRIRPTAAAIDELTRKGVKAKLLTLAPGVTHYDTAAYAPAMRDAVVWLQDLWK